MSVILSIGQSVFLSVIPSDRESVSLSVGRFHFRSVLQTDRKFVSYFACFDTILVILANEFVDIQTRVNQTPTTLKTTVLDSVKITVLNRKIENDIGLTKCVGNFSSSFFFLSL